MTEEIKKIEYYTGASITDLHTKSTGAIKDESLADYITRLKQENEKLKEKVKSRENELANMAEQANMRINKYRSALEEIRKKCNWVNECSVTNDNLWEYDEILNIINEVLQ